MRKTFDCVEMMHQGGAAIYEEIKDLTLEGQIAYWEKQSREFQQELAAREHERKQTQRSAA